MEIILWDFLMLYQISFSGQMKGSAVITNNQGVYELLHNLPNKLRLMILGNQEKLGKI